MASSGNPSPSSVMATGWPSTVGVMANWTTRKERGTVMGVWATCYQFGGVCATWWASMWLAMQGWRGSFFAASAVLVLIWFYVFFMLRNRPEDVGLELVDPDEEPQVLEEDGSQKMFAPGVLNTILLVGCFYFFEKVLLLGVAGVYRWRSFPWSA